MTATVSAISNALTTLWPQAKLDSSMFEESPVLALMPKEDGFTENTAFVVFNTSPPTGRSADFAEAQANLNPSNFYRAEIQRVKDYALWRITTEAMRAAKMKGPSALLNIVKKESTNMMYNFRRSAAVGAFGSGSGSLGVVGSGGATDTITLADPEDAVNFEEGMILYSDTVDGGGTVDNFRKTVGRIDYDAGTMRTSDGSNWNSAGGFGDGAFLFAVGDYDAKPLGLKAWLPVTVSSTDAFGLNSLNRSVNRVRLAGVPHVANLAQEGTLSRIFTNFVLKIYRIGQRVKPDVIVCNTRRFGQLVNELGGAVIYDKMTAKGSDGKDADFGFQTVKLATAKGFVNIVDDPQCPVNLAYALKLDTWKVWHLGGFPSWLDDDGSKYLRVGTADAHEWRMGAYFNIYCDKPVNNGVCDLSAIPIV